jgi:hypothetical protein
VKHLLVTLALLAGCLALAVTVANVVDLWWPGTFLQGRNFWRVALMAGGLIAAAAFFRPSMTPWRQLLVELLAIEAIVIALVWGFSSVVAIDRFFLSWWLGLNTVFVLPWLAVTVMRRLAAR